MNLALFGDKLPIMTDYKTFFGLSKEPFAALAAGNDVFVAPQVASTMAVMKKALTSEDAIVTVSGPVGTGKTTVARRALESVSKFHIIVSIGRIQFGHDEVLELLLAGLGVRQLPKSTVHRFATFRRVLQQYAEQQTRVFILIEDATRVGLDALSELEAVTAADAGVSGGANLILLGDESLPEFLRNSRLARVKQRIRARLQIAPQSEGELQ
ncbi:MAG: AAA family ATPase, partial [Pseudomonadota bacterium]